MKKKRIIAGVMAVAVGLLAGCVGRQDTPTTEPQQTVATVPTTAVTTEPTEVVTVPTETVTVPTEPQPVLLELNREERYEINIFLSNFSEQWFHEGALWDDQPGNEVFYSDQAAVEEIVDFVWLFAKINRGSQMEVVHNGGVSYYAFELGTLDSLAQRFFGRTLSETELRSMDMEYYALLDGMVCGPAADGETYMNMTVTDRMVDLGDGTMGVDFTIYSAWAFADAGGYVDNKELYYLTGEQARSLSDLELHLKGTAVVRPQTLENGRESYQLVSYELYNQNP